MLLTTLLLSACFLQANPAQAPMSAQSQVDVEANHGEEFRGQPQDWAPANSLHVPGTPPPSPQRERDTPPIIKDKPLPPVSCGKVSQEKH